MSHWKNICEEVLLLENAAKWNAGTLHYTISAFH